MMLSVKPCHLLACFTASPVLSHLLLQLAGDGPTLAELFTSVSLSSTVDA